MTGNRMVSYAQQDETTRFFSNATTVLPQWSLPGGDTEPFRGPGNHPRLVIDPQTSRMEDRCIIPERLCFWGRVNPPDLNCIHMINTFAHDAANV